LRGHHKQVSEHLTHVPRYTRERQHHEAGRHETAPHRAHIGMGHISHARGHAEEAVKALLEEHARSAAERRATSAEAR
jgi:hypothetical protein